jgi:DNA-binding HxlR family transcriptional regulator/putative sterol carrier protein
VTVHRTYEDACGLAHALDLVGERWALLVARELVLGPKRFSDLKVDLPTISTNVLSHRLDELERAGIIRRRHLPAPAASWIYELTDWGTELEPVMRQLGRWGARSPSHRPDLQLSTTSFILSLRTNFDPRVAGSLATECGLRIGEDQFRAKVANGTFKIQRGAAERTDAVIEGSPEALAGVIYGGGDLAGAIAAGDVGVEGDPEAATRFLALFTLPVPAGPAPVAAREG